MSEILFSIVLILTLSELASNLDTNNSEKEYLKQFGYLNLKDSPFVSSMVNPDVMINAIKNFQRMAGLEQTGVLDVKTKKMMQVPRCGVRDLQGSGTPRRKRYVLYGSKWEYNDLTYKFINHAKGISKELVEKTVEKAFRYWQSVSSLTFRRTSGKAIIDVEFRIKHHGDDDPFDGTGGTLAHAYFPTRNPVGGDIHFDDDETWTFNENRGTNLLQVAVHELGHSLGLAHSDVQKSIMAPFYRGYDPNLQLDEDDIRAIQRLYGPPAQNNMYTTKKKYPGGITKDTRGIRKQDGLCSINEPDTVFSFLDLFFVIEGEKLFVMKGFYDSKAKQFTTTYIFPKLPKSVDAAFYYEYITSKYTKLDYVYFFKDSHAWKYLYQEKQFGFTLVKSFPKRITAEFPGIPSKLNAAFEWNLNGKVFFFKGKDYYRFSQSLSRVASNYPRSVTNWNLGVETIDSVFNYPSRGVSETFFISGNKVYKYDEREDGLAVGFPKSLEWFFGCTDRTYLRGFLGEEKYQDYISSSFQHEYQPFLSFLLVTFVFLSQRSFFIAFNFSSGGFSFSSSFSHFVTIH